MAVDLPDVTLVVVDNIVYHLTQFALARTRRQINPANLVWNVDPLMSSMADVERCLWTQIPLEVHTSHMLVVQYDSWVLDGTKWDPAWLEYDYIGAPWSWHPVHHRIGNGGFSLRSLRLAKFLANNPIRFPVVSPEDQTLCIRYRDRLQGEGFKWAPEVVAREFAFERGEPRPSFGFHGLFNIPKVLDPIEWTIWKNLAPEYVRNKVEWREVAKL